MQAAQDAADYASGKTKAAQGVAQDKYNAAAGEASNAAEYAQGTAADTVESGKGIWQKVLVYCPFLHAHIPAICSPVFQHNGIVHDVRACLHL